MPPRSQSFADPAAEASQFLIRLGLAALVIGIPIGALFFRRAIFLLFPLGAGVILLGALLAPRRDALQRMRDVALSPMGAVAVVMIVWAGLSLIWTPAGGDAVERLFKAAGTMGLAAAAAAVLPDRTRVANLYLAPIGVGAAALCGLALAAAIASGLAPALARLTDASTLDRSLVATGLLMWPALAALGGRERAGLAIALAIVTASAAATAGAAVAFLSMAAGGLAFAATVGAPREAPRWLGRVFAASVALAPALPFLAEALVGRVNAALAAKLAPIADLAAMIREAPLRLLTGHGLDSAAYAVATGFLPAGVPRTAIFDVWYELGVIGAVATALLLWGAFRVARRAPAQAEPALAGGLTHGLIVGSTGVGSAQIAWLTAIAVGAIAFTAMTNGLYKTARPFAPTARPR